MNLYEIVFDFFETHVFVPSAAPQITYNVGDGTLTMADWLNHTATIATLVALVLACFLFVRWLVKLIGNGVAGIGR